jgi:ADP-ribose pyrophosphatase YjhB (NUDIX family)
MAPPYTVAPHLEYFNIPLAEFSASRPEFESFAVGGYIFSEQPSTNANVKANANANTSPRILLIQRAMTDTMSGCWEGPGGAVEPDIDQTLLDGVAREVLEETGLNVSRFVDLVGVDSWQHLRRNGDTLRIAKYSFIIDVYEAKGPYEEIPVRLEPTEHQAFDWALEEEVREVMQSNTGKFQLPFAENWNHGPNLVRAFAWFRKQQAGSTK